MDATNDRPTYVLDRVERDGRFHFYLARRNARGITIRNVDRAFRAARRLTRRGARVKIAWTGSWMGTRGGALVLGGTPELVQEPHTLQGCGCGQCRLARAAELAR